MKTTVIILSLFLGFSVARFIKMNLDSNTGCVCGELQQTDCTTVSSVCTWANSTCSSKTVDCTTLNSTTCSTGNGCALNANSTCAAFTKCGDYNFTDTTLCYGLDQSCSPGTPCVTQTVTSCATITDETTCEKYGCLYNNKTCGTKYCANITKTEGCTQVGSMELNNIVICAWNSTCVDSTVSSLTSANCLISTQGTYKWNGQACTACTGSSSTTLLAFIGFAATLLY